MHGQRNVKIYFCLSGYIYIYIYIAMHGQQNVKIHKTCSFSTKKIGYVNAPISVTLHVQ